MEKKALALLLICIITLLLSFMFSFISPIENFIGNYSLLILVLIFFFFGVIGFGFFSFIPHLLLGLSLGAKKNAIIFLYIIPIFMATYAGLKLGSILLDDFNKKKYFLEDGKNIIILITSAIILAITIEFTLPILIETQLWPEDLFGMNIERPESVTESLEIIRDNLLGR